MKTCDTKICKAECCGPVPVNNFVYRYFKVLVNKGSTIKRTDGGTLVYNQDTLQCGFLSKDFRCKIYDNRPEVCRKFAEDNKGQVLLKCHWLGQIKEKKIVSYIEERS